MRDLARTALRPDARRVGPRDHPVGAATGFVRRDRRSSTTEHAHWLRWRWASPTTCSLRIWGPVISGGINASSRRSRLPRDPVHRPVRRWRRSLGSCYGFCTRRSVISSRSWACARPGLSRHRVAPIVEVDPRLGDLRRRRAPVQNRRLTGSSGDTPLDRTRTRSCSSCFPRGGATWSSTTALLGEVFPGTDPPAPRFWSVAAAARGPDGCGQPRVVSTTFPPLAVARGRLSASRTASTRRSRSSRSSSCRRASRADDAAAHALESMRGSRARRPQAPRRSRPSSERRARRDHLGRGPVQGGGRSARDGDDVGCSSGHRADRPGRSPHGVLPESRRPP